MEPFSTIKTYFSCPHCNSNLHSVDGGYFCTQCQTTFPIEEGRVIFTQTPDRITTNQDDLVYRVKSFLKKYPSIFFFIYNISAVFVGKRAKDLVRELPPGAFIINVGSGAKRIDPRVINIDLAPEVSVDVVASAYALPLKNNSVDLVITESLLEHLEDPAQAVREMYRVLKPGGIIYVLTPFMLGFHSSPNDFYRWTLPGMKILLKDFDISESSVAVGPTSAMTAIMREWLAMLLSFNIRALYQFWTLFFMVLFIPVNWIDFLLSRYNFSSQIALAYYWIGTKK